MQRLRIAPDDDVSARKTRMTLWAPLLLIANGLFMSILLIRYYVQPYQQATGTLAVDGSLDLLTGESMLALSWSVVYVILGVLAIMAVRRDYLPSDKVGRP